MAGWAYQNLVRLSVTLTFIGILSKGQYIYEDSAPPTPPSAYYPNGGFDYEYDYQADICTQRDSCDEMRYSFLSDSLKNCYCDDLCQAYGDCCEDFHPSDLDKTYEKLPRSTYSCHNLDEVTYATDDPVYKVDKCPKDYSDEYFKSQCERGERNDMFTNIPVSGQTSGILYRNYFCAVCHSVPDISFWNIGINCNNSDKVDPEEEGFDLEDTMETMLSTEDCNISFLHHTHAARYCKENVISRCHSHWKDKRIKKKCKSGTQYRFAFQKIFKNEFCAECNFVNTTYLDCTDGSSTDDVALQPLPPLSILLDLNTGRGKFKQQQQRSDNYTEEIENTVELRRCLDNHIYDPFAKICRLVTCRQGYKFENGECVDDTSSVTPYGPHRKIVSSPQQSGEGFDEIDGFPASQPSETTTPLIGSGFDAEPTTLKDRTDSGISYLDCPFVTLKASEYHFIPSGIYVPLYSKSYGNEEYANITDGEILICTPFISQNYNVSKPTNVSADSLQMFQYDRIQGLISYIGLLISIICLFVVFVIYMMFPALRNYPGKCVVSLVVALLLAQLSFLVGGPLRNYPDVCFSLGVLTHYFYLASFFWINVLSIGIFRSVSANNVGEDRRSHFVCASFYSWMSAALIVGVALVMQFVDEVPEMFKPMYGDGICWITRRWPLIFTFASPIGLILIANIILFIGTSIRICLTSRAARYNRTGGSRAHQLLLYVKLCLIMGLTWIFGFVAAMTDLTVLWYVFIVLNSLHGAYICFAFVCTRNVLSLLSGKGEKNKDRVTGGNTNSTSNGTPSWAHTKHTVLDTSFNGNPKVIESRETCI